MTDPQWRRVRDLYEKALALPPDDARALLQSSTEAPEVKREASIMLESLGQIMESRGPTKAAPFSTLPDPPPPNHSSRTVGRYEVFALIGSGATGEVYAGRDRELGRPVALKFMMPEHAGVGSAANRFIREAQAASALNHPNIVTVHEVITWEGSPVIVMELVDGAPLRAICGHPLPLPRVIHIGSQILQALAFAHANGIVHRDLKPENVMVRPDGYVKVLDLGLARQMTLGAGQQNISSTGGLPVGTLRYMSPEQCRGQSATPASDVFAAGIVLYEMATGRHPFSADSPLETAHAIAFSDPAPPTRLNPAIPPPVESLILKMMAKLPADRPSATVAEKALAPAESTSESTIESTAISTAPHTNAPPARRITTRWIALGLALIAALVFGFWRTRSPRVAPPSRPSSELRIHPLAGLLGAETQAAFSPDGTRVAFIFSSESDRHSHIYVKDLSGGHLTQVTANAASDFHPAFSPDGTKLAFVRQTEGPFKIMMTPSTGGIEHQIGELKYGSPYSILIWDAGGGNLLVSDFAGGPHNQVSIFQISVETGARRQLTFPPAGSGDLKLALSPDGHTLGFGRWGEGERGDLWEIPAAGGPERRVTHKSEVFCCWSWTADGKDLLISYRRSGRYHLWRQPVDGGRETRVAGMDDQVLELAVARTGNRLAYRSSNPERFVIWRYPIPPSTDPPKRLIASAQFDGDPSYSPDGSHIAFASARSGQGEIWTCASDGSDLRQLTSLNNQGFTTGSPNWSPDGRWIAFDAAFPEVGVGIFLVDALGGTARRLTQGPSDLIPTWSRDSRWVYFTSDRGGARHLWKVSISSRETVQVTPKGGAEAFESPDGRFLYYRDLTRKPGVWRLPLADGYAGVDEYVPGLESVANRYWDHSGQGIYFIAPFQAPVLRFFRFSDGKVTRVADVPAPSNAGNRGISVSPDGRAFLHMHGDLATTSLTLVENFR